MLNKTISYQKPTGNQAVEDDLPVFNLRETNQSKRDVSAQTANANAPKFNVNEEIARGGEGLIYSAQQNSLKREIAIKKHLPSDTDSGNRQRFIGEAVTTAIVEHPNVVPIHDLGEDADGEVVMSMKLVKGTTWAKLLHPATPEEYTAAASYISSQHLSILLSVCNAIAYAHSKFIAHCDLKPENIMVGEFGEVLVMDWGIAVDFSGRAPSHSQIGSSRDVDTVAGTPFYLAPELARGDGVQIGPWTDIYLLGGLLYEVFNGQPPHQGNTLEELLNCAVNIPTKTVNPSVPKSVKAIYNKALQKDFTQRHQNVEELIRDLNAYINHKESIIISDQAQQSLETCLPYVEGAEDIDQALTTESTYTHLADSVAGYKQALNLWPENPDAVSGIQAARTAYANFALDNGDTGVALSQAADLDDEALETYEIRSDIQKAVRAEKRSRTLTKLLKFGLGAALVGLVAGLFSIIYIINADQKRSALAYANVMADSLTTFRAQYSSRVIKPLKASGITVTHEPKGNNQIPYPATFSIDLANVISETATDAEVRLYSNFPFPWRDRGGPQNNFESKALAALEANPTEPYYEYLDVKGQKVLHFAKAVTLKASCIGCHNSHPDSPKVDWKEGDVRGAQSVIIPIESSLSRVQSLITDFGDDKHSG
ncbi:MAG: serine/threonine protein kinase [Saprospiraceae bacterium]|jgi:serine/threonine protein kinase